MPAGFSAADQGVFVCALLCSLLCGFCYELYKRCIHSRRDPDNFLHGGGGRKMLLIPAAASLFVSYQSSVVIIGMSSEMYTRGMTYWWAVVGIFFAALLSSLIFVPVLYPLKLSTVNQYLSRRFGSNLLRKTGALLHILVSTLYMSVCMYAPSVALASVTDWLPLWALITISGVVSTLSLVLGGLSAIVYMDVIWLFLMISGLLTLSVKGTVLVGGVGNVLRLARENGRAIYFDYRLDPFLYMTGWSVVFGQLFSYLGWYGVNQTAFVRYNSLPTKTQARSVLLLNAPMLLLFFSLVGYCGLTMFSYFSSCDPLQTGILTDQDQLLPYFASQVLANVPGFCGLFVASLFAATLSSVTAALNTIAVTLYEDILKHWLDREGWTHRQRTRLCRTICLAFGIIATLLANIAPYTGGVLKASLATLGAVSGPLTGIFLLGIFVPFANAKGALVACFTSLFVSSWLCVANLITLPSPASLPTNITCFSPVPEPTSSLIEAMQSHVEEPSLNGLGKLYSLSFCLYEVLAIFIVFVVALPVSLATGGHKLQKVDQSLYHPIVSCLLKSGTSEVKVTPVQRFDSFDPYCQHRLTELKKVYIFEKKHSRSF